MLLKCFFVTLLVLYTEAAHSSKKGLAVPVSSFRCNDLQYFTGVSWWYDWAVDHKYPCSKVKCGRIPMVWGSGSRLSSIPKTAKVVLGYNEPNFRAQSNMSPETAAKHWRELERHAEGKLLVSPAAGPCGSKTQCWDDAIPWFKKFFENCKGCRVDHLATHAYWCNPDITMHYLESLWNAFKKPIWVTEISCPQTQDPNKQLTYMKALLPRLEAAHYVHKYAWFATRFYNGDGWVFGSTSLLDQNSNRLTTLGEYYNNF